jgi:hypothetical protein
MRTADAKIAFSQARFANFTAPRTVIFGPLPKTSTGKIRWCHHLTPSLSALKGGEGGALSCQRRGG